MQWDIAPIDNRRATRIIENNSQIHIGKLRMDPRMVCKTESRPAPAAGSAKYRRLIAGTMVIVVLAAVMFSITYIAVESGHECCGKDCHICASIRECEKNITQIRSGTGKSTNVVVVPFITFLITTVMCFETVFIKESPVSDKIRLNI